MPSLPSTLVRNFSSSFLYARSKLSPSRRKQLIAIILAIVLTSAVLDIQRGILFGTFHSRDSTRIVSASETNQSAFPANPVYVPESPISPSQQQPSSPNTLDEINVVSNPDKHLDGLPSPHTTLALEIKSEELQPLDHTTDHAATNQEEKHVLLDAEQHHPHPLSSHPTLPVDAEAEEAQAEEAQAEEAQPTHEISATSEKADDTPVALAHSVYLESPLPPGDTNQSVAHSNSTIIRNLHTGEDVVNVGYKRAKCYAAPGDSHDRTCAPSILVAGYEKCGTSALYFKLATHPDIAAHPRWKEFCPTENSMDAMWSWFEDDAMPALNDSTSENHLLNGCIGIVSMPTVLEELIKIQPNLKVLISLRNYADWSYSYYGYRCYPGFDEGCEKLEQPNEHGPWKETRSPENFAQLVATVNETGKPVRSGFGVVRPNVALFQPWLEKLMKLVGKDSVKIIKQEDLSYSPKETLADIASFVNIEADKFPESAYTLVSNTNANPSLVSEVDEASTKSELSAVINSGSVISEGSRTILNDFWKSECLWLKDTFSVHFSDAC